MTMTDGSVGGIDRPRAFALLGALAILMPAPIARLAAPPT